MAVSLAPGALATVVIVFVKFLINKVPQHSQTNLVVSRHSGGYPGCGFLVRIHLVSSKVLIVFSKV
jgi:hypothetical protein